MSVYRQLSADDLEIVRRAAGAEAPVTAEPIAAGIENSNWFVSLADDRTPSLVLTVLETEVADLAFCIAFVDRLAEAGLPVPRARALADGTRTFTLQGHTALLLPRLPGEHATQASLARCTSAGAVLAAMHLAGSDFTAAPRARDRDWWPVALADVASALPADTRHELEQAAAFAAGSFAAADPLPRGMIHGDFFRDNVLFRGERVSGVLDFFHATHDLFVWDLAIALNDWSMTDDAPDHWRADAMIAGYDAVRPLSAAERAALPALRRTAAARFWLSRLQYARRTAATGTRKDPEEMRRWWRALG